MFALILYSCFPEIWLKHPKFCFVGTLRTFICLFLSDQIVANRNWLIMFITLGKYTTKKKYFIKVLENKYICIFIHYVRYFFVCCCESFEEKIKRWQVWKWVQVRKKGGWIEKFCTIIKKTIINYYPLF